MNTYMLNDCRDILLESCRNGHFRELINNHKKTVIAMLCGWYVRHVIHLDELPGLVRAGRGVYTPCFSMGGLVMS